MGAEDAGIEAVEKGKKVVLVGDNIVSN